MSNPTPEIAEDLAKPCTCWMGSRSCNSPRCQSTPPKVAGDAEEIDRLEALLAKATPRPWVVFGGTVSDFDREWPGSLSMEWVPNSSDDEDADPHEAENAALIVAAVNALPSLIAHIRATASLAVEIEALQLELDEQRAFVSMADHGRDKAEAARLAVERKLEAAVGVLGPFVDLGPQRGAWGAISKKLDGLSPLTVTVTKAQMLAACTYLTAMNTGADDVQ